MRFLQHKIQNKIEQKNIKDKQTSKNAKYDYYLDNVKMQNKNKLYERQLKQKDAENIHYILTDHQHQLLLNKINKINYKTNQKENYLAGLFNKKNIELKQKYEDLNQQNLEVQAHFEELNKKLQLKNLNKESQRKNKDTKIQEKLQRALSAKRMMMHNDSIENKQKIANSINNLQKQREIFNEKCNQKFAYVDHKLNNLKSKVASYNEEQKIKDILNNEKLNYNLNKVAKIEQKKIENYKAKHKKFDERIIQIEREKESQMQERQANSQEYEEIMRVSINEAEKKKLSWRENVKEKIDRRTKSTEDILFNKQRKEQEKIENNNEEKRMKDEYIKQIMINEDQDREMKREEWENKIKQINDFLKERHNIEQQQIEANDEFNNQKTFYNNQIDYIIGNKYFNKNSLETIQEVIESNPNLSGLVQNLNNN